MKIEQRHLVTKTEAFRASSIGPAPSFFATKSGKSGKNPKMHEK